MLRSDLNKCINDAANEITKENAALIEGEIKAAFSGTHIKDMTAEEANAVLAASCVDAAVKLSGAVAARLMQKLGLLNVQDD